MINTVLMDLDGTLLPFKQDTFIKAYLQLLCKRFAPKGYTPEAIVKAVWAGCEAMVRNDGTVINRDRFWDAFAHVLGEDVRLEEACLDEFYLGEFDTVRAVLQGESCAKALVEQLKAKGYTVVLATNPLFPEQAQRTRMAWAGLIPSDFHLVTHYTNSRFCKPNLQYYKEILQVIGKTPKECLMIGNSVEEDMMPASALGMDIFLVSTYLENPNRLPTDSYHQGLLEDFARDVETWPTV